MGDQGARVVRARPRRAVRAPAPRGSPPTAQSYFDASPEYPPTMPLLQVWSCLVLGRWDDTLMNGPWWLRRRRPDARRVRRPALARRGRARRRSPARSSSRRCRSPTSTSRSPATRTCRWPRTTRWPRSSLLRWVARAAARSTPRCAVLFAVACTQIKNPGLVLGRDARSRLHRRPLAAATACASRSPASRSALVAARRARALQAAPLQLRDHLDYAPAWADLAESYFLLGNWHILWYGAIAIAILAWRSLLAPALAAAHHHRDRAASSSCSSCSASPRRATTSPTRRR